MVRARNTSRPKTKRTPPQGLPEKKKTLPHNYDLLFPFSPRSSASPVIWYSPQQILDSALFHRTAVCKRGFCGKLWAITHGVYKKAAVLSLLKSTQSPARHSAMLEVQIGDKLGRKRQISYTSSTQRPEKTKKMCVHAHAYLKEPRKKRGIVLQRVSAESEQKAICIIRLWLSRVLNQSVYMTISAEVHTNTRFIR